MGKWAYLGDRKLMVYDISIFYHEGYGCQPL